jgi:uncharacterized protein (TIGR03663 family)
LAAAVRLPSLDHRPFHHDEANQAYRFGLLLEEGGYQYDAEDHHGPTLYYLTQPLALLAGAESFAETSIAMYRLVPVVAGCIMILLLRLLRTALGRSGTLSAMVLLTFTPAFVFYSRYYIQELLLTLFTVVTLGAGWLGASRRSMVWSIGCGVGMGCMLATKETAVLTLAAFGLSGCILLMRNRLCFPALRLFSWAVGSALLTTVIWYTNAFTSWDGLLALWKAVGVYAERGLGEGTVHLQPWNYYLEMLTVYRYESGPLFGEGIIFGLGLLGVLLSIGDRAPAGVNLLFHRFLSLSALFLTFVYSLLPYKTPWCILSMLLLWVLLAGIGLIWLLEVKINQRRGRVCLIIGLSALLCWQSIRVAFLYAADVANPYVYAQTSERFSALTDRLEELRKTSERDLYIQVIVPPDRLWPLPFYLRKDPLVGYWSDVNTVPEKPVPDVIITVPEWVVERRGFRSSFYELRPDCLLVLQQDDLHGY